MAAYVPIKLTDEVGREFRETADVVFRDGSRVTAEEIWRFLKEEAPSRYPGSFNPDPQVAANPRLSEDIRLYSALKRVYLQMTLADRVITERRAGKLVALIHHFQSSELYFAAGLLPLSTIFATMIARNTTGKSRQFLEGGQRWVSVESCDGLVALNWAVQQSAVPIDLVTPALCTFCSDIPYVAERHRTGQRQLPLQFIHYPANARDKDWAIDYLAGEIRRVAGELCKITGREITEETLSAEIIVHNRRRKLLQQYTELWWKAEHPPTTGLDHIGLGTFSLDYPDPVAAEGLLKETIKEIKARIKRKEQPEGLASKPVRIYAGTGGVISNLVDKAGGVLVGDDLGSPVLVREKGDPYENLAKAHLQFPFEMPSEERADWIAERVKKTRAEGAIFTYYWGCNNASAITRLTADIVREKAGVPTVIIETNDMYKADSLEQVRTRIEAFVEILRNR
jgi:benzoyl-CoA reductase/2-hydroxyglutaryl-CoA dehydratase subunit BcrC/BadD/HgdB